VTLWTVPRAFPGGTVVVMASGPSLSVADAEAVRSSGFPTIAVKAAYLLAPWAWMLYGAEWEFWRRTNGPMKFAGHKVSIEEPSVFQLRNTGIDGFDPDPSCVRTGNNSGYQAVHAAIHTGAARIVLLGFDMKGGHFNGRKDGPPRRDWIPRFEGLAGCGAEIINCTPGSALTCFPRVPLADVIG
jgi:hypothetical protein